VERVSPIHLATLALGSLVLLTFFALGSDRSLWVLLGMALAGYGAWRATRGLQWSLSRRWVFTLMAVLPGIGLYAVVRIFLAARRR
jgi:hypothetical protein